jgi:organic radical activating enzyme
MNSPKPVGPPLWLLLELTYRCPLHCVFCYNPTEFARTGAELSSADWLRVLREARALGAVQLGLSGGEPLVREDLEEIVAEAHRLGFYINLITSGIGLTEARIKALKSAGLDHIQLSFQDSTREMNDFLSSTRTFELKSKVAALIREHDYPMVLNVVLHRHNIDHVGEILDMAERNLLRGAGLFRDAAQGLHERAGFGVSGHRARWHRHAVSRRAHAAGARASQRAHLGYPRNLVRQLRLQSLPRRCLDEGALPQLPREAQGLRRLPLPGVSSDRRCGQRGSGVRPVFAPRPGDAGGGPGGSRGRGQRPGPRARAGVSRSSHLDSTRDGRARRAC